MPRELHHNNNEVAFDDHGRIVIIFKGHQDRDALKKVQNQTLRLVEKAHSEGKQAIILIDALNISTRDTTSGARMQARQLLDTIPFDKLAICGRRAVVTLAVYIVRLSRKGQRIQFFSNKQKAIKWLMQNETHHSKQASASLIAGIALIAIGVLALIGWHLDNPHLTAWMPELRPINPLSALALLLLGAGFITYSKKKTATLRLIGGASIFLGIASLLPIRIDTLLYGDRVASLGIHGEIADSGAVCFIAFGALALLAHNDRFSRRFGAEVILTTIIGFFGFFNAFGQLYARDWIYDIGYNFVMPFNLAIAMVIASVTLTVLLAYSKAGANNLARISRISILIITVLALTQAATYLSWQQATTRTQASMEASFQNNALDIKNALDGQFVAYNNLLYGFQGLFRASGEVSQAEFEAYYQSTKVDKNYPGLETLTYISKVPTASLPAFTQKIRKDTSLYPEGNPNFSIAQQSLQNEHYILTYAAGSIRPNGLDFSSNPARSDAFRLAEQKHRPVASGTVTYAATNTTETQNGFFITVPISSSQDPNRIIGFVNAIFAYKNFFKDTFQKTQLGTGTRISIIDKQDGKTVLSPQPTTNTRHTFVREMPIAVADRTWLMSVTGSGTITSSANILPWTIFITGQIFSLFLIVIFWLQARARKEALDLAGNVTEDLQRERNLAIASDQRNRTVFASIGDGIFAVDTNRVITLFNPAAESISGHAEREAIGLPYSEIIKFEKGNTESKTDAIIKQALHGIDGTLTSHALLVRKDGKFLNVSSSAASIRDANNRVTGAIIVIRDETEEYEFEKTKSEFVSLTSHQLRTPLSAINWYAEMLMKGEAGKLTKDQAAYMNEIFIGSNRMNELVNALLNASRLEIDKLSSQPEPTDIAALIESLSKEFEATIKDQKISLRTNITPVPAVDADPKQLRMIVLNLISNAVKFSPAEGTIDVTLRPATANDMDRAGLKRRRSPYWYFSVQDTGYGIPKDDQAKIFGKLFRAENARSLNVQGTGLGLFIVKKVIEKLGGRVWFESVETVGTTFYVVAPNKPDRTKNDVYNITQEEK